MIFACDVDLTVVDTGTYWRTWLEDGFEKIDCYPEDGILDYNLSVYFGEYYYTEGYNHMDFWRYENLYDGMVPIEGSIEALERIHSAGHDVVFVSAVKGNHHGSKFRFLKKHFPFMGGLLATKEKEYAACHVAIDDRNSYLNKFARSPLSPLLIKYQTPYTQDVCLEHTPIMTTNSWNMIDGHFIKQLEEEYKRRNQC